MNFLGISRDLRELGLKEGVADLHETESNPISPLSFIRSNLYRLCSIIHTLLTAKWLLNWLVNIIINIWWIFGMKLENQNFAITIHETFLFVISLQS